MESEFKNGINYSRNLTDDTEDSVINILEHNFVVASMLDKININYAKANDYLLKEKDIVVARNASPGDQY
jgi:hypothetical protein